MRIITALVRKVETVVSGGLVPSGIVMVLDQSLGDIVGGGQGWEVQGRARVKVARQK